MALMQAPAAREAADYPELAELAQALLAEPPERRLAAQEDSESLSVVTTLRLSDLLVDSRGELVLKAEGPLVLQSHSKVLTTGSAHPHVTACGEDVSGLNFVSFASGVTLYYPPEMSLNVIDHEG